MIWVILDYVASGRPFFSLKRLDRASLEPILVFPHEILVTNYLYVFVCDVTGSRHLITSQSEATGPTSEHREIPLLYGRLLDFGVSCFLITFASGRL